MRSPKGGAWEPGEGGAWEPGEGGGIVVNAPRRGAGITIVLDLFGQVPNQRIVPDDLIQEEAQGFVDHLLI
jgi:hypothetical protein